jgi:hypothetical protein
MLAVIDDTSYEQKQKLVIMSVDTAVEPALQGLP